MGNVNSKHLLGNLPIHESLLQHRMAVNERIFVDITDATDEDFDLHQVALLLDLLVNYPFDTFGLYAEELDDDVEDARSSANSSCSFSDDGGDEDENHKEEQNDKRLERDDGDTISMDTSRDYMMKGYFQPPTTGPVYSGPKLIFNYQKEL